MAVIDLSVRDNMSAGIQSAADSLNRLADAADKAASSTANITQTTSKVGPSFDTVNKRIDENAKLTGSLSSINTKYVQGLATVRAELDKGGISAAQAAEKTTRLGIIRDNDTASATKAAAALAAQFNAHATAADKATSAIADLEAGQKKATVATDEASGASSGFTREMIVLAHELTQGNFSRIPGSLEVLTERSKFLTGAIETLTTGLIGWPGVFLAAGAAVVLLGVAAESNERRMLALQTTLRGTRDDYVAVGAAAEAAARQVASTSGISLTDARAGATAISAQPNFKGTQDQLAALIKTADDLKTVTNITFDQFAAGIQKVGDFAQSLADKGLTSMSQSLADTIKKMEASGKTGQAYDLVIKAITDSTKGAADQSKTGLQQAIADLGAAFVKTGDDGKSFGDLIGHAMQNVAITVVEQIKEIIDAFMQARQFLGSFMGGNQTNVPTPVVNQINDIAERNNFGKSLTLSSTQADFGVKIAQQESGGKQFNDAGGVLTSPKGNMGIMQISQAVATQFNVNPNTAEGNISGGLQYINELWTKYHGDTTLVAMAYNWGPGNTDAFLAGTKTLAQVPNETTKFVKSVTGNAIPSVSTVLQPGAETNGVGDNGVGITPDAQIEKALTQARAAGTSASTQATTQTQIDAYTTALANLAAQGTTTGDKVKLLKEALTDANVKFYDAVPAVAGVVRQINNNIAASNGLSNAYTQGDSAVNKVIARNQAVLDLQGKLAPSAAGYAKAVADLTQKHLDEAAALGLVDFNKTLADTQKQTDAQLRINSAWDGSSASLVHLTDVERARAQVEKEGDLTDEQKAQRIDALTNSFDQAAAAAQTFQQQQASVQAISGAFSQAFSTIGNAITQAFVSGQGAAVNWGNIVKSVLAQVIQQAAQLAILNPILNSVFGQNNGTLGVGLQTLAQGGGSNSSSGSSSSSSIGSSLFSGASTASSVSGAFGGPTLGSSLGLTGPGGLLTGTGSSIGSSVSGFLATDTGIGATGLGGIGAEGAVDSAQVAASGVAGASVGAFAGGIGAGFAAGSLAGGLVQGSLNKAGPAPEIGAAAGAVGGAVVGSLILPGIGTVIGGLIGGILGGAGGGLIGPHKASVFSTSDLFVRNGGIGQSDLIQQGVDGFPQQQAVINQIAALQAFESQNGISATSQTGRVQIGINNPGGFQDPTKFNDLNTANGTGQTAFSKFQFGAQDPIENAKISVKSFATTDELQAWVTAFNTAQLATKNIISGTTNLAGAFGVTVGSVSTSLAAVNTQFDGADTTIKALLASEYLSTQQTTDLTKAEGDLNTLRAKSIAQINQAAYAQNQTITQGFTARDLTAEATLSGRPADAETAQLYAFDISAQQQRDSLKATEVGLFGDAIVTNKDYLTMVATLEGTLGNERLAIQKSYNDQIAAVDKAQRDKALTDAGTNVVSLSQYVQKLQTGSNSPLSVAAQLDLSRKTFATDRSQIQRGDLSSLPSLTTDADALLAASRAMFGSGTGFGADFKTVIDTISSIANLPVDTLTGAIFTAETKTQTAVLSDGLTALKGELAAIRLELRQVSGTPAQVAA